MLRDGRPTHVEGLGQFIDGAITGAKQVEQSPTRRISNRAEDVGLGVRGHLHTVRKRATKCQRAPSYSEDRPRAASSRRRPGRGKSPWFRRRRPTSGRRIRRAATSRRPAGPVDLRRARRSTLSPRRGPFGLRHAVRADTGVARPTRVPQ